MALNALRTNFREDIGEYRMGADVPFTSSGGLVLRLLFLQRLQAVLLLRLAANLHKASPFLAVPVKWFNQMVTGADLASQAVVGPGLQLFHPTGVVIGPRVVVGQRCKIMQGVTLGHGRGGSPIIGDDVFIGANAVIVGGITVGNRVFIGASSVVTFDVPDDSLVRAPRSTIKSLRQD